MGLEQDARELSREGQRRQLSSLQLLFNIKMLKGPPQCFAACVNLETTLETD